VVNEFNAAGVAGFDYWFLNNYHFINQWGHLKNLQTVSKLPIQVLSQPQDYNKLSLPKTQNVVGRLISFGIRCTWTDEQMKELASKILACVDKAMKPVNA
jgi:8-amino-3,8-dideoxy-alpha-D-manno-octulosonate transaminase